MAAFDQGAVGLAPARAYGDGRAMREVYRTDRPRGERGSASASLGAGSPPAVVHAFFDDLPALDAKVRRFFVPLYISIHKEVLTNNKSTNNNWRCGRLRDHPKRAPIG